MRHVRLFRAVDAVARCKSIRAAAAGLAISPSALNRQMQALEEELGVELFERLPRGVRLSTAGEIYLRTFRAHIAELERAAAQVSDLTGLRAGTVRLGVGPELAAVFAPTVAAGYRAEYPEMDMEIAVVACDQVGEALRAFDVDLYVGANPVMDDGVETIHAEEAKMCGVGAFAGRSAPVLRLSHLVETPLVVNSAASGLRRMLDAAFAARLLEVRYAVISDQLDIAALGGNQSAVQLALSLNIDDAARRGAGLEVRALRDASPLFVKVVRLRARRLPVGAAKFADRLVEVLSRSGLDKLD